MFQKLIEAFNAAAAAGKLPYANINSDGTYAGWVRDFGFEYPADNRVNLDLRKESDLFGLFALAIGWSRSGPWENSALLTAYLKHNDMLIPKIWTSEQHFARLKLEVGNVEHELRENARGLRLRKDFSIRSDVFGSIRVLADHWEDILCQLDWSNRGQSFDPLEFAHNLRSITGLAYGSRRMLIKIPLILRELRCQQALKKEIPGHMCCVPDARVRDSAAGCGVILPRAIDLESVFAASRIIYEHFGDLYDLPLFAYPDLLVDLPTLPEREEKETDIRDEETDTEASERESSFLNEGYFAKNVDPEAFRCIQACPQIRGKDCLGAGCPWHIVIETIKNQPRTYYSLAKNQEHHLRLQTANSFEFNNLGQSPALRFFAFCFNTFLVMEMQGIQIGSNVSGMKVGALDTELRLAIGACAPIPGSPGENRMPSFKRIGSIGPELCRGVPKKPLSSDPAQV